MKIILVLGLTLLTPVGALGLDAPMLQFAGRTVVGLEVEGSRVNEGEVRALVPFTEGSIFRADLVREGVVNFYRTGLYDSVEVQVREETDGVVVRYVVSPRKWLGQVQFKGNLYVGDQELLTRVDLRSSEEITDEKLESNLRRLLEYYRFRGFAGTAVTFRVEPGTEGRTRVIFSVVEGDRLLVSDIRIAGDGLSRGRLLTMITSMPGTLLDGEVLDSDVARVRSYLRKRMYLTAKVRRSIAPDPSFPGAVRVTFHVDPGPLYRLKVRMGDEGESQKQLKRMRAAFLGESTPERARAVVEERVLLEYRRDGYPFTVVNWEEEADGSKRTVVMNVDRGRKAVVSGVVIEGLHFFTGERARDLVGIAGGDNFVKARLEAGVADLERAYRLEGFLSAAVTVHPLNFIAGEAGQEVPIRITVEEGPRTLIGSLSVSGSPLPDEATADLLGLAVGGPYVPEIINTGRDALLQELGRRGYLYAAVTVREPETKPVESAEVEILVEPGPKVRLGSLIITGNESVDTRIIRLALDLRRGEILTRSKLLEAQERIYRLRMMSSVDVRLADPDVPDATKDLLVEVQERARYVVGLRMGYGSEDRLRGEVSVTNRNLKGMARTLSLRAKASDIERGTTLTYAHPWFGSLPIDMTVSLSDLVEKRDSYSRDSRSAAVDFVRSLSEKTESRLGYMFEGLRLFDVAPDAQLSADDEGRTDVAALVAEILYDDRDDFLDPRTGVLGDVVLEYGARWLGSKTQYYKWEIAMHKYLPLDEDTVLAGLLRLGLVTAYGRSEEVIISKRFFLGGQNSVRGYQLDSLGPKDASGDPVGGNYLVNANLELRYPLYGTLRGVFFVDSGSVWLSRAADPENEDFTLRAAGGAGLRWSSPIGPLSLDYGYKLNPAKGDGDRFRWHFSIGHAF